MQSHSSFLRVQHPLRTLALTLVLAAAATVAQTASAASHGGMGGVGGMGGMANHGRHGMHEGMGGPGMPGPGMGMMGGPRQMERLLDRVDASAEQRAQIRQILAAARADMAGQHEAGRKLHEQNQALFAQPTVDARAVEALRVQMLAQHDQASKRMTQAMLDVSRVLTPEQRKAMSDQASQRRQMMERHRAERAVIDPKPAPR